MDMSRDRNLLFGVFAVQLRGVFPEQLVEVSAAWSADPSISVAQRMVDRKILTPEDKAALEKLVDDAVRAHGGNSGELLGLFGGEQHVEKIFFNGATSSYLDNVDTSPMEAGGAMFGSGQPISGVSEAPGRYTLVSHHAKGGMGRVLIVHDEHLGRNIALKELLPMGTSGGGSDKPTPIRQSASLIARFLQEARITSQLEHPAIVPVYEMGRREDGTLYYTMRLVRGKTFSAALRECAGLDARLALLSNFVSLCQAIAYAHSRGIIHRDIKPANVMLGQFGETVVLDWGLAKLRDAEDIHVEDIKETLNSFEVGGDSPEPMTAYGRALGTPHYMPPEQAAGLIDEIDERSDVYSLGAVLYEILTGTTPHSGKNTREIIEKVLHEAPLPVLQTTPDAPPELAVICEKALNRGAADRYQSASELAAEVERFIQGSLVRAYRYSLRQILAHYYTKHRPLINTALACTVLLVAVVAASYVSILHARNREHEQRLVAETARQNENTARTLAERKTYQSQIHLAQAHIREKDFGRATDTLWETAEKERGWEWGYLLNRANPDVYTIESPNSNLFSAVFSPDGKRIGTNTAPGAPSIYEALTGKKLVTLEGGAETYAQTAFSPDGTKYMGISWEGMVNLWDAATGKRLHRFPLNAQGYSAVFDPTGNFLFAGAGDRKVHVFDLQSGAPAYELTGDTGPIDLVVLSPKPNRLLTTAQGGVGQLWNLETKTPIFTINGELPVFSPDGSRIAVAQEKEAIVLDAETGAELVRLKGHTQQIYEIRFNGNGSQLLTSSQDGSARLWDLALAKAVQTFKMPEKAPVANSFFLNEEGYVLAISTDNQSVLFDAQTGSCISRVQGRGQALNLATLQPGGSLLALTSDNHALQVLNPLAPTGVECMVSRLGNDDGLFRNISASASGERMAFLRDRNIERIWLVNTDTKQGACSFSASFGGNPDLPLLSDDGLRLAMTVDAHTVAVVANPDSTNPSLTVFAGHAAPLESISLGPEGRTAASADTAGEICLWSSKDAQVIRRWKAHEGAVTHMEFSQDGQRLLSCGLDGQISIWSCDTSEKLRAFERQDKGIASAVFNEGETRILSLDVGGIAQIWDAEHGKPIGKVVGGQAMAIADNSTSAVELGFLPGGSHFMTRLPGEGGRLWDAATMTPLLFFNQTERVLPLRDSHSMAIADRSGNLRTVLMSGTPGGAALDRADFRRYQTEWASRTAISTPKGANTNFIFISHEDLVHGIEGLVELSNMPGQAMLCVKAESRSQAVAAMLLNAGDLITAINDTPCADGVALKTALEIASGRLSQNSKSGLTLSVLRNTQERRLCYWTLALAREEVAVTLTRDEALWLMQHEIDSTPVHFAVHPDLTWLPVLFSPEDTASVKAHLVDSSVLTAVDGMPCASVPALRQTLLDLKQRVASGATVKFVQTFRDGVCRELTRSFTVEEK